MRNILALCSAVTRLEGRVELVDITAIIPYNIPLVSGEKISDKVLFIKYQ